MNDSEDRWREVLTRDLRAQAEALYEMRLADAVADIEAKCKSPIEALFAAHLNRLAPFEQPYCLVRGKDEEEFDYVHSQFTMSRDAYSSKWQAPRPVVFWWPQCQIDMYRVDFLFMGWVPGMEENSIPRIVVECDGFDWHERTKSQAIRDRERDRYLHDHGFLVYRYLGSEIWKNPQYCVDRIVNSMFGGLAYELHQRNNEADWA